MAQKKAKRKAETKNKKTSIGNSTFTKHHNKGGGSNGSSTSKLYKKRYRGQGKRH